MRTLSVGDGVFEDENADGLRQPGESGMPGVLVELRSSSGTLLATTTTAADGSYEFTARDGIEPAQQYEVRIPLGQSPLGGSTPFDLTTPNAGGDDTLDSDATEVGVNAVAPFTGGNWGTADANLDVGFV